MSALSDNQEIVGATESEMTAVNPSFVGGKKHKKKLTKWEDLFKTTVLT